MLACKGLACWVPRIALSPESSQQTHSVGALIPISHTKKLRPGGDHFPKVTQLTPGRTKAPTRSD